MDKEIAHWHKLIQEKAKKKILYSYHATVQMNLEDRLITTEEVREVITKGKIIEERIEDVRGATFLINAKTKENRYVHVVCSPKDEFLTIVTAYVPDDKEWTKNFSTRRNN